jgi:CHAT domain-containing protein
MSGAMFARRSRPRVALGLFYLAAQALLLAPLRAEPVQSSLSPEQRQKLKERDRLQVEVQKQESGGRLAEAIAAARKKLALERQVFGEVREDVAGTLGWLARLCQQHGDFAAARQAAREALAVRVKLDGPGHWRTTDARLALADLERQGGMTPQQRGRLAEAERLDREVAALCGQGRPGEAVEPARRALQVRREVWGEDHPASATSLYALAWVYYCTGRRQYAEAEPLLRQALAIRRRALGKDHPQYALILHDLAVLCETRGAYGEAEALYTEALEVTRKALGERHPSYTNWLSHLTGLYARMAGKYRAAEDFARAAAAQRHVVELMGRLLGEQHWQVTDARLALADLERQGGMTPGQRKRLAEAERLHAEASLEFLSRHPRQGVGLEQRALEITKEVLGEDHPDHASRLYLLARLYHAMDEYAEALPLYDQVLSIRRRVLGAGHPECAKVLGDKARLYYDMGRDDLADKLDRRVLEIRRRALGEGHPDYLATLDSQAERYKSRGLWRGYAEAARLYEEALRIRRQVLGERHPDAVKNLHDLATVYRLQGDNARAVPLFARELEIRRQALGEQSGTAGRARYHAYAEYAAGLNDLAVLHLSQGEYGRAEALLRQALAAWKQAYGEHTPDTLSNLIGDPDYATSLGVLAGLSVSRAVRLQLLGQGTPPFGLGALYGAATDVARAERLEGQALKITRVYLENAMVGQSQPQQRAQSQREQLAALAQMRSRLDRYLSLPPPAQGDAAAQYTPVLDWKGTVGRRQRLLRLARHRPELAKDLAELDRVSSRLAALALAAPDPEHSAARARTIRELTVEKERLERSLAGGATDPLRATPREQMLRPLTPAQVQRALPADAALVDFLEYDHYSPSFGQQYFWRRERALVAFVVRRDALVRVDLGPAQPVREALERWREALQRRFRTEGDARLGAAVRRLVWRPLEPHLRGARLVLVSPDGLLTRVPFAALPGSRKDSYLLEEAAVAVVPVPRLLPELLAAAAGQRKAEPSLLVLGDVAYDAAPGGEPAADRQAAARRSTGALFRWGALPNTGAEVTTIAAAFRRGWGRGAVTQLCGARATEAAVRKETAAHRYVHLATHGFFAPRELRSALAETSSDRPLDLGILGSGKASNRFGDKGVTGLHPGLLSGLVLAGANRPADPSHDDGILTALEVEGLDLDGVELVTLSACETGLGEEAGGEGLLGLQRAFQIAGARAVVAGLWQVDDAATRKLMTEFYRNLWEKKLPRLEALRAAQLWMLRAGDAWMQEEGIGRGMADVRVPRERLPVQDGRLAPYYWAAFSLSGDWR